MVRSRMRLWAGRLHGGQLVMLHLLGLPMAVLVIFVAGAALMSAWDAGVALRDGNFLENPLVVQIAGRPYEMTERIPAKRLQRIRFVADSFSRSGRSAFDISSDLERAGIPLRPVYYSSLHELDVRRTYRFWALPILLVGLAYIPFMIWTVWVWLGARAPNRL